MTDLEGNIWLAQENDEINFIYITKKVKNKIQALNEKGREIKLSEEKLLWRHPTRIHDQQEWLHLVSQLQNNLEQIQNDIDVSLLWESALELELSELSELAELYFGGEITTDHLASLWKAMATDRLYFKRRGRVWEARSAEQVKELQTQREREQEKLLSQTLATDWLQQVIAYALPSWSQRLQLSNETTDNPFVPMPISTAVSPFIDRLECWLRGDHDKLVEELLTPVAEAAKLNIRELVFEILQKVGRLPLDADRDVIVAGLKPEFSVPVNEVAQAIKPWLPADHDTITELFFSIDDDETREVDDALAIECEGDLWKVTIAISDPACVVHRGDALDREAMRRGTTVYLPTQTVLMLPAKISCDIASLTAGEIRSSFVIRAWLDDQGQLQQSDLSRETIRVRQRLSYRDADGLIATGADETAQQLRNLQQLAHSLFNKRVTEGAFVFQRPEYKVTVENAVVDVTVLKSDSSSRLLVAEMMILANNIAARYAQHHQVPIIYRTQEEPLEPITAEMLAEPLSFYKVRKLLRGSTLSLQPGGHSGLGLSVYTQLTSPLRRFADLVIQRQLVAHLVGEELPYDQEELFKVLATAEKTARDSRQIEGEAKKRWFMIYLQQTWRNQPLSALVIDAVKGGYKMEMQPWGVDAFMGTTKKLMPGDMVIAVIEKIRIKASSIYLTLVSNS